MPRVLETPFIPVPEGGDELGELEEGKRLPGFPDAHVEVPFHPKWLRGKESACNAGDVGLIPGSGRSPGEVYGNLLQYSCLGNPMDRGAW